jgi:hypothetical protein
MLLIKKLSDVASKKPTKYHVQYSTYMFFNGTVLLNRVCANTCVNILVTCYVIVVWRKKKQESGRCRIKWIQTFCFFLSGAKKTGSGRFRAKRIQIFCFHSCLTKKNKVRYVSGLNGFGHFAFDIPAQHPPIY